MNIESIMAASKIPADKRASITVKPELKSRLTKLCKDKGIDRARFIDQLLTHACEELELQKPAAA